jgi:hypothetical protein
MHPMPPVLPTFLAVYALLYAAFGVQSPFLAALLYEQGFRAEEIGTSSLPPLRSAFSPGLRSVMSLIGYDGTR